MKVKSKWIEYGGKFCIAGVKYSDYQKAKLAVDMGVIFIGEPRNVFDRWAIRIECNGVKIGYVPAGSSIQRGMWDEHNRGSKIQGRIVSYNKSNPTWEMIVIQPLIQRCVTKEQGEVLFHEMRADLSYR